MLCQLTGEAPFREEMARWQPGFAEPGSDLEAEASAADARRVDTPVVVPDVAASPAAGTIPA